MFRMSLWAEHLKTWEESFRFPGTLECTQVLLIHVKIVLLTPLVCTQRVKEMCNFNWQSYNFEVYGMDQMEAPPGHLLLYPVQVSWKSHQILFGEKIENCLAILSGWDERRDEQLEQLCLVPRLPEHGQSDGGQECGHPGQDHHIKIISDKITT